VRRLLPGDDVLAAFPRPPEVYAARFGQGAICFGALVEGEAAGFIWFTLGAYEEDEVHCTFDPVPHGTTAWDFDVYVAPRYRYTSVFARLWDAAYTHMRASGVDWTMSRISAFNAGSIRAHIRLGAVERGTLDFLCVGPVQLAFGAFHPRLRLSVGERGKPAYRVHAGHRESAEFVRSNAFTDSASGSAPRRLDNARPAIVVGLCAHGLACVRSLARAGLTVYAVEANPGLPGCRTRHARVFMLDDINGSGLVSGLRSLATEHFHGACPVLILTNDKMVKEVATRWDQLEGLYRLSWASSREVVSRLLSKMEIERACNAIRLQYPRTWYLSSVRQLNEGNEVPLGFPLIVKPSQPLSGFKARLVENVTDLRALADAFEADLPFLVQDYVAGSDVDLRFVALYLRGGESIASFTGRKLLSHPPAMGQTTAAEAVEDERLLSLARRFFEQTGINGPASLEFKLDADGVPWVIEPTVGRTDYWLDCCVANGVDFTLVEYLDQTGNAVPVLNQKSRCIWMDAERDPKILARVTRHIGLGGWRRRRPRFTFWNWSDPLPFIVACRRLLIGRARQWLPGRR